MLLRIFTSQVNTLLYSINHSILHKPHGSHHKQTNITDKTRQHLPRRYLSEWNSRETRIDNLAWWIYFKGEGIHFAVKGRLYMNSGGRGERSTQKASSANLASLPSARRFLIVMDPHVNVQTTVYQVLAVLPARYKPNRSVLSADIAFRG